MSKKSMAHGDFFHCLAFRVQRRPRLCHLVIKINLKNTDVINTIPSESQKCSLSWEKCGLHRWIHLLKMLQLRLVPFNLCKHHRKKRTMQNWTLTGRRKTEEKVEMKQDRTLWSWEMCMWKFMLFTLHMLNFVHDKKILNELVLVRRVYKSKVNSTLL